MNAATTECPTAGSVMTNIAKYCKGISMGTSRAYLELQERIKAAQTMEEITAIYDDMSLFVNEATKIYACSSGLSAQVRTKLDYWRTLALQSENKTGGLVQ
jgi:hypothetical protein